MQDSFYIGNLEVKKSKSYPNYAVSYCGKVFRISSGKEMSQYVNNDGYLRLRVCHNNKPSNAATHIAVAECWVDNPDNKPFVNHKDGNKANPHADNLEWVTAAENQRHAVKEGLKQNGEELYNSKLTDSDVHEICKLLTDGMTVKSLAERFNVKKDNIRKIKDGSCYFHVRKMYTNIPHTYKGEYSESTVRWVCDKILEGVSDKDIAKFSSNKNLSTIDVKRIRHKIRYSTITDEYF